MWIVFALFVYSTIATLFGSDQRVSTIPGSRTVPQAVKRAVAARDAGSCRKCGSKTDLQYDHVVPYSLGGRSDDPSNIQLLCGRCNRRKSNKGMGAPIRDAAVVPYERHPPSPCLGAPVLAKERWREGRCLTLER